MGGHQNLPTGGHEPLPAGGHAIAERSLAAIDASRPTSPLTAHWGDAPGWYSRALGDSPAPRRHSRSGTFDSIVKVRTEGSGRTARHPGSRVPVRSLCDGSGVHSAGYVGVEDRIERSAIGAPYAGCSIAGISTRLGTSRPNGDHELARSPSTCPTVHSARSDGRCTISSVNPAMTSASSAISDSLHVRATPWIGSHGDR